MSTSDLLLQQKKTYEQVYLKEPLYDTPRFHYDWWLFPIKKGEHVVSQSSMGRKFSIDEEQTKTLIHNTEFMERYLHCIQLYLNAQISRGWNGYVIRYEKVLWSIVHFLEATKLYNLTEYYCILWRCSLISIILINKEKLEREITRSNSFSMFKRYFEKEQATAIEIIGNMDYVLHFQEASSKYTNCTIFHLCSNVLLISHLLENGSDKAASIPIPSNQPNCKNPYIKLCFDKLDTALNKETK